MAERWPAQMRLTTLCEYLDMAETTVRKIVNRGEIPAVQHDSRGDRYYLREDADAYLARLRASRVASVK